MIKGFGNIIILFFVGVLFLTNPCYAENKLNFKSLQKKLIKDGFDKDKISKYFSQKGVKFEKDGVSSFFMHNEFKLNYNQFKSTKSIKNARKYLKKHKINLSKVEKKYGVDRTIVTAVSLVETRLGTFTGRLSVFNVLATMAALQDKKTCKYFYKEIPKKKRLRKNKYDLKVKRRSNWAYLELKSFIKYTVREKLNMFEIRGSYAGAFGIPQFMPSNAMRLAKDGNGDGKVNLLNHEDSQASIANYLKHYGWKKNIKNKKAKKVLFRYNHSLPYVKTLLEISEILKKRDKVIKG
ncbi:MAG: lytic murein transglycosylase [Deltaproteobacteria bacterium]|nr:lytic murein transglycosylase [Deltaproteobacteria bacterium]